MAEKLCPVCGKANPEDADICAFCQADLTAVEPTIKTAQPEPSAAIPEGESAAKEQAEPRSVEPSPAEAEPEWLQSLRDRYDESVMISGGPAQADGHDAPAAPTQPPREDPQWLKRIRERSKEEDAQGVYSSLFAAREEQKDDMPVASTASDTIKEIVSRERSDQPPAGVFVPPAESDEKYSQFLADLRRKQQGDILLPADAIEAEEAAETQQAEMDDERPAQISAAEQEVTEAEPPALETAEDAINAQTEPQDVVVGEEPAAAGQPAEALPVPVPPAEPQARRSFGQRLRDFFGGRKPEPTQPVQEKAVEAQPVASQEEQTSPQDAHPAKAEKIQEVDQETADSQPESTALSPPGEPSPPNEPDLEDDTTAQIEVTPAEETAGMNVPEAIVPATPSMLGELLGFERKHVESPPLLRLSDRDKSQAQILEALVKDLFTEVPKVTEKPAQRRRWVKPLVTIAFVGLILFQLQFGKLLAPVAYLAPAGAGQAFADEIKALPEGATVLVAFELEPAYSGEISYLSSPVLQQLMREGVNLALVSTNPTGPVLAESLANDAWVDLAASDKDAAAGYAFSERLINLGYLPGGIASLQSLGNQLSTAVRAGFNDSYRREDSLARLDALEITRIAQFDAVILLADRFEAAQPWMEQVSPLMGQTPLLVVSSAQAAPLMRPYIDSGQVAGMLAGLNDGLLYTHASQLTDVHQTTMTAYYSGAVVIVLIFSLGLLMQLIASGSNQSQGGEQP